MLAPSLMGDVDLVSPFSVAAIEEIADDECGVLGAAGGAAGADRPPCQFPAIYNFGDSNSDTGGISAAFRPIPCAYGATFFGKAARRNSDGRLLIDLIDGIRYRGRWDSMHSRKVNPILPLERTSVMVQTSQQEDQPSVDRTKPSLSTGYARSLARCPDLALRPVQIEVHLSLQPSVLPKPVDFSKALYTSDIGQNDLSVAFRKLSAEQQIAALPNIISQFSTAVQHLYEQGARLFWIPNTGPIGCLPVAVMYIADPKPGFLDPYGCIKGQNDMAIELNRQLKDAVVKLRTQLPEAAITYVDLYAAKYGLISTTKSPGFVDPLKICCGYHEKDGNV
ncbi:GDSL esterase/lipase-like protein [Drosera capensis]